jgi:sigma-B regulation protein RsbU (phosphoserine phosphatase)
LGVAFGVVLFLRGAVEKRVVLSADDALRPRRQFLMDLSLFLAAGLSVAFYNTVVYRFPPAAAISLLIGCMAAGFFTGMDTALARERSAIYLAREKAPRVKPPKRLYPVTRRFSMVALSTSLFISLILMMVISRDFAWLAREGQTVESLKAAEMTVWVEVLFIMAVLLCMALNLILSYSRNLKLLFENETRVLEKVARGDLSRMVPVTTRDEFGLIAGHTNTMIKGLRHRSRLVSALKLAEEVQQSLLPAAPPEMPGIDITGISRYCDETGGDYYDYLALPGGALGVVVADASDHGIGAALHMATARAFLVSSSSAYRGAADLVTQVNRFLSRDHRETGRFITLFFLEIDIHRGILTWVRAGHEPALLYERGRDRFIELSGTGIALGVVEDYPFSASERRAWEAGSVLLIGTDGIREARNRAGEVFGETRIRELIRENADQPVGRIQEAILSSLERFRSGASREDDVTLVVIRLLHGAP